MVRKLSPRGHYYHEPPYTEEEQRELYGQMSGVRAFTRPQAAESPPQRRPDQPSPEGEG